MLIDCRVVSQRLDGLGRYTVGLVRAMLADTEGVDLALLAPGRRSSDHPLTTLIRDLDPHVIRCDVGLFSTEAQVAVPLAVRRSGAGVFHYPHFNLPFATPGRVVATIHDLTPLRDRRYFARGGPLKRAYFRLSAAYTLRRATAVITPTTGVARDVERAFGGATRIVAVPEGVSEAFARPAESSIDAFRARYALQRPYLLYVGVRRPHKNLERVVRAYAQVAREVPHDLILVGQGPADEPLLTLAERNGAGGRVRSLGYLDDADVALAYAGADAFLLCSLTEGFGLGVLEAMKSGTPVIATASGATGEVAGDAALLIDPLSVDDIARAMRMLCGSAAMRAALRERGYARAARFTWREAARRTLEIYRQAL